MQVPLLDLKAQYKTIEAEVRQAIDALCQRQDFILGEEVKKLESEIAAYSQAKFAVGCASGSDALLLSLLAFGIGGGDEVITTPFTFFATAGAIYRTGARIVFVDIEPKTFNIDVKKIKAAITKRTKAIMPVHLFGQCAEMDPIMELAKAYNLKVVEDAAQSIGSKYKGRFSGSIGDAGCLSFFPSKNLGGFGDGGMVLTNDEDIFTKLKMLRVHGSKDRYFHEVVGFNSRLDTLQAAVLLVKFKYLKHWNLARQEHALRYNQLFKGSKVLAPYIESYNESVFNQYVIRASERDALMKHLKEKGIGCAVYYPLPLHLQTCFKELGYTQGDFPESEKAAHEVLAIPVYPELAKEQQEYVAQTLLAFTKG
jgi:dTDP-4-amino-4,6-dideoxygalactose transaminase